MPTDEIYREVERDVTRMIKVCVYVIALLLVALALNGCSTFPQESYDECIAAYPNEPVIRDACAAEVDRKAARRIAREDLEHERLNCRPPFIWDGRTCRASVTIIPGMQRF